jgi:predicted anti-sigma-YlaC factor YlaD
MDNANAYGCADAKKLIPLWLCDEATIEQVHTLQQHLRDCPDCHAFFLTTSASRFFEAQDDRRNSTQHAARLSVDDVGIARVAAPDAINARSSQQAIDAA